MFNGNSLVVLLLIVLFELTASTRIANFAQYCENVNEDSEHILCQSFDFSTYDQIEFDSSPGSNADLVRFENCNLRRFPTNFFEKYRWVVNLRINNCKLKTLRAPKDFDNLDNLDRLLELNFNGNLLDAIPVDYFDYFPSLRKLDFGQNFITIVKRNAFANATNLRNLYLERNKIVTVEEGAFDDLQYLYSLDLSGNSIEKLSSNIFSHNHALQSLQLQNNKIQTLDERIFSSLTKLENLNLSENPLVITSGGLFNFPALNFLIISGVKLQLNSDMFKNLPKLIHLDLSNNSLTQLNTDIFHSLPHLREILLNDNELSEINYTDRQVFNAGFELQIFNNKWNCSYLAKMIHYFREESIDFNLPSDKVRSQKNTKVVGISCVGESGQNFIAIEPADLQDAGSNTVLTVTIIILLVVIFILGAGLAILVFKPPAIMNRLRNGGNAGGVTEILNVNYQ